jgi:hypothetical protein
MRNKLHKLVASTFLVGVAALLLAPSAEANRGNTTTTTTTQPGYVPPPQYGQNPHPEVTIENPYDGNPTVVPVNLPAVVTDPGAGLAGGSDPLGDVPTVAPATERSDIPKVKDPSQGGFGGILSRTGAETMPLARAGLAGLALGLGLVVLARRRRPDTVSA